MKMLGLLAGMAVSLALPVAAQDFPSKPIRIIAPFGPGTATDTVARVIGAEIGKLTGQAVVIENKPGAEGQIGAQAAATAAPDGYTMFITTQTTQAINQHVYKSLTYDPVKNFTPVCGLTLGAQIVMVKNELPVKTVGRVHRARPQGAGQALLRQRQRLQPRRRRTVSRHGQDRPAGRAVQDATPGHQRSLGWAHRRYFLRLHGRPAGRARRPRPWHRRDQQEAHPRARAVPDGRFNRARLRDVGLDRGLRSGRHAAAHRRQAERAGARGDEVGEPISG